MPRHTKEAKEREIGMRKTLGRRTPKSPPAGHRVTTPPKTPRATGATGQAIAGGNELG